MTWSKVCSWNEYRNPWKFNDRMYMYIYYLLLLELLYIIYLTWTKHNLKIVIQGRTNLLLVLKNECVTMRESLIICKDHKDIEKVVKKISILWYVILGIMWALLLLWTRSLLTMCRLHVFLNIMFGMVQKKIGFFFMSKFILVVFDILILKILFFNLKLWLTF